LTEHKNTMIECSKCLFNSENYPEIQINENGICNLCLEHELIQNKFDKNQINHVLKNIKKQSFKKYNCIIGVSGGVDSTFLVKKCVEWGLKPLLVHIDGGWNTLESQLNIKKLANHYQLDLETIVLPWEEMADLQKAFILSNVIDIDLPFDNAFICELYKSARKNKIKDVLLGYNLSTESPLPSTYTHYKLDAMNVRAIHRAFGVRKLRKLELIGTGKMLYYKLCFGIRFHQPLQFIPVSKQGMIAELEKDLSFKPYKNKHEENFFTRFYQAVILPKKFNKNKEVGFLSSLIRSGQISREEGVRKLELSRISESEAQTMTNYFCKKLNISQDDFQKYLIRPAVAHENYSSEMTIYKKIKPFYRLLKRLFRFDLYDN